jgi:hypothetical protein
MNTQVKVEEKINLNFLKMETKPQEVIESKHDRVREMIDMHTEFMSDITKVVKRNGWERKELYVQSDRQQDWSDVNEYLRSNAHRILDIRHEAILGTHVRVTVIYEPKKN